MKKVACMLSVLALLLFLLPGEAKAQYETKSRFGFKLCGGMGYAGGGDINTGLKGWSEFWTDFYEALLYEAEGEYKPAHWGANFGGEFIFYFTPSMGVGVGVGYIQASAKSTFNYTNLIPIIPDVDRTMETKITAIPITASFHYSLSLGGPLGVNFHAGLGYYPAKVYAYDRTELATLWSDNEYDNLSGGGIGFHGGVGLEFKVTRQIAIFFETQGRYAAFSNFEGDENWSNNTGASGTEKGKLWIYDSHPGGPLNYTVTEVKEDKPAGVGITNCREAKIDFSGFSALLGIILRL